MESWKFQTSQNDLKKSKHEVITLPKCKMYYKIQWWKHRWAGVKQTYKLKEADADSWNKLMHVWSTDPRQQPQEYTMGPVLQQWRWVTGCSNARQWDWNPVLHLAQGHLKREEGLPHEGAVNFWEKTQQKPFLTPVLVTDAWRWHQKRR